MSDQVPWWHKTIIYQIYPRSFQDSNGDGIGDLRGIIDRLDYLQDLGFETLWLSPFFSSPQQDWGYDVSDYCGVAPEYGTLADTEELITQVHRRGMRILFDLVMNHTSIQHPWFQESRSSRDNPRRDWYIWRNGRGKRPPNNWRAIPGGSGWHYDKKTDQWYYASFLPFQPDLNYRNPDVKKAMFDVARFWLDLGVDGFRLDIFHSIYKDALFRNNPLSLRLVPADDMRAGFFQTWRHNLNQPETIELAKELRALLDSYQPERVLLGEIFAGEKMLRRYLGGRDQDGLHMLFMWDLPSFKLDARYFRRMLHQREKAFPPPYSVVNVLGNHDRKRTLSRARGDRRQAALLAVLQYTARGVPVTYYGEEIGMREYQLPIKDALDPLSHLYRWVPDWLARFLGLYLTRDGCRTPMQWDTSKHSGFCCPESKPWLPLALDAARINVETESTAKNSLLDLYCQLISARRNHPALQGGSLELLPEDECDRYLLGYRRRSGRDDFLILINFGTRTTRFNNRRQYREIVLSAGIADVGDLNTITLPAHSALILTGPRN